MNVGGGGRSRKPVACRTLALNKCNKKRIEAARPFNSVTCVFHSVLKTQLHTEISFLGGMHWYLCSDIRGPLRMDSDVSHGPFSFSCSATSRSKSPVRFLSHGSRATYQNIVRFEWTSSCVWWSHDFLSAANIKWRFHCQFTSANKQMLAC